jgi:hypothetical protein
VDFTVLVKFSFSQFMNSRWVVNNRSDSEEQLFTSDVPLFTEEWL